MMDFLKSAIESTRRKQQQHKRLKINKQKEIYGENAI